VNVAFVLVSYQRDAPAGMERAVAALLAGLRTLGHQALVISAASAAAASSGSGGGPDEDVIPLRSLTVSFPSDDEQLRSAILGAWGLEDELRRLLGHHKIDVVCYVDALWGLGRSLTPDPDRGARRCRTVLMVHVVGYEVDLRAALARQPDAVLVPSATVLAQAARQGYETAGWQTVPNALLDGSPLAPTREARDALRRGGPVRLAARLGAEKGALDVLAAAPDLGRLVEVALASAGFEQDQGAQGRLLDACRQATVRRPWVRLGPGLPWQEVRRFLAAAGLVLVPSRAETFGLVALEAMSVGTPVVAFAVDNLPALLGPAGRLVPPASGPAGLWRAGRALLADPVGYAAASTAGPARAAAYHPVVVARRWIKAVGG